MAKGDQEVETVIVIMRETIIKVDTSGVMLSVVERCLEMAMNPPAGEGLNLMLSTQGNLLVQNTGYDHLLKGQTHIARGESVRDTVTVMKDADQGADQATGQGPLLEELTEQEVKNLVEKGSTKLDTWRTHSQRAQASKETMTPRKLSRNSVTATKLKIALQTIEQAVRQSVRKRKKR